MSQRIETRGLEDLKLVSTTLLGSGHISLEANPGLGVSILCIGSGLGRTASQKTSKTSLRERTGSEGARRYVYRVNGEVL